MTRSPTITRQRPEWSGYADAAYRFAKGQDGNPFAMKSKRTGAHGEGMVLGLGPLSCGFTRALCRVGSFAHAFHRTNPALDDGLHVNIPFPRLEHEHPRPLLCLFTNNLTHNKHGKKLEACRPVRQRPGGNSLRCLRVSTRLFVERDVCTLTPICMTSVPLVLLHVA